MGRFWEIDEIGTARIDANFPANVAGGDVGFTDIRDESGGRKSVPAWLVSAHLAGPDAGRVDRPCHTGLLA